STTCSWDVTGTADPEPVTECWETATFNNATCSWEVSGTQDPEPTTECWETATFNNATCSWEITGTQDPEPQASCGQTVTFNSTTCSWEVSGTADPEPVTECWQTATFNNATCSWEVTGTQDPEPIASCGQTVTFNSTTCSWEVTGTEAPIVTYPADESMDISINPTINWQAVNEATGYRVIIGTSLGGTEIEETVVENVLEYTVTNSLDENSTYFVSVFAITNMGESDLCSANEFTTEEFSQEEEEEEEEEEIIETITEGISPFFTPNNDGYHDTWNIEDVGNTIDYIYVLDRFGKILKQIRPESEGWDGTYKGKSMPEDDYWYVIVHDSGAQERGHFSLIKR
ncbi:gliding motility-associated C-terminal domain-containing protein, partial [Maribacter aquivivus]